MHTCQVIIDLDIMKKKEKMMDESAIILPDGTKSKIAFSTDSIGELDKKFNTVIESYGSLDDLESVLSHYSYIPDFVHNYYRARYFFSVNDFGNASKFMDRVLRSIESNERGVQFLVLWCAPLLQRIYRNAGEIYANNNEYNKSLHSYQDYELVITRITSCDISEGLSSFRAFNEHSLADLINNEITVCSPRVMNDPYDTLLMKWGENLRFTQPEKKHVRPLCDSFESYRIRSFCHLSDKDGRDMVANVLMWAHYANNHKGYCIKYCFSDSFIQTEERRTTRFREINYPDRDVPFNLNSSSINTDQALCTKFKDWEYENEVRLITYIPDIKGDYLSVPLDKDSYIESVYFGYRCTDETITTVRNVLKRYDNNINYFKMNSDYSDIYRLKAKRL